jgi:hypothetical protein
MEVREMTASDRNWQAKNDMQTITEAMKIQRDKKRLKAAKAIAKETMDAMMMGIPDSMKKKRGK